MITNSEIADLLSLHAQLLELNDREERRYKTFANAAYNLERLEGNVCEMNPKQLLEIQGIGKAMVSVIHEILTVGTFEELEELKEITPIGVIELFKVKGIGVKKIKALWQELGIDSLEKLKSSCKSSQIAQLKGFGEKTQVKILESIAFIESQRGKLRVDKGILFANELLELLNGTFEKIEIVGQVSQFNEVIDKISFIALQPDDLFFEIENELFVKNWETSTPFIWRGNFDSIDTPIEIHLVSEEEFMSKKIILSSDEGHLRFENKTSFNHFLISNSFLSEEEAYVKFGSEYIIPEMRVGNHEFEWIKNNQNEDLITWEKLKGILHNHSTYSDGKHSLRQMAEYCKSLGFEYLGIADHSQTATYAQGLTPLKVEQQHIEIEKLNAEIAPFKILKGIESDILLDGSLDYSTEILASFDFVVASVHQTLGMDIEKATKRLLKAIENPFTTILGHPTGRLLLSREGYPLDFKKIIDACADNNVIIELNASPYRLDIDWRWIPYCLEKGVKIIINPDAHSMEGYHDMFYGVGVARKGGLTTQMTFNALGLNDIEEHLKNKKLRA